MKFFLLLTVLISASALADGTKINVRVNGMVCAFCAQGITKKFKAQPAVDKVDVKLDEKLVSLDLKDGQDVNDDSIRQILKDSGYTVEKIDRSK